MSDTRDRASLLPRGSLGQGGRFVQQGGVFGNPRRAIWDAIGVALDEAAEVAPQDLSVVVNARSLGSDDERSWAERLVRA